MSDFRRRALQLMDLVRGGELRVEAFCEQYETLWNFERRPDELTQLEERLFEELFDVVAAYSPLPEEREMYPRYKSEADVLRTVSQVRNQIG